MGEDRDISEILEEVECHERQACARAGRADGVLRCNVWDCMNAAYAHTGDRHAR